MTRFEQVFGRAKPVIAMVHLGAMPGTPLHDGDGGVDAILRGPRPIWRPCKPPGSMR